MIVALYGVRVQLSSRTMMQIIGKIAKWLGLGLISLAIIITLLLLIFRKDIQQYAISQLDQFLDTKVYVYDMDVSFWKTFPNISIQFDRVLIKDEMIVQGTIPDTLLYAETIQLKLNTSDFWKGDYTVKSIAVNNARIGLRVTADGRVNYNIIKSDTTSNNEAFKFVLEHVKFNQLHFTYDNYITEQHYHTYAEKLNFSGDFSESRFDLKTAGNLFINRIRSKSVSLITNKKAEFDVVIAIDKTNKAFILENSSVSIENLPFVISGSILEDSMYFNLSGQQIALTDFAANFNQSDITQINTYNGNGNVDFNLSIKGNTRVDEQPLIEAAFEIKNGSLIDPSSKLEIKKIELKGEFSNHRGKNEVVILEKLNFVSLNSRFEGKAKISHFDKPEIKFSMNGNLNLATVHHFFKLPGLQKISGNMGTNASAHFQFNNPKSDPKNITIFSSRGDFDLQKIALKFSDDLPEISNISGKISTNKDNAVFKNLFIQTGKSNMEISGSIKNILAYFTDKSDLLIDAVVEVPRLYSADFYSNKESNPTVQHSLGSYLLPKNLTGTVLLSIHEFHLDNHLFETISGRFNFKNRSYASPNIKFKHVGSHTSGSIQIDENKPGEIEVAGKLNANEINFSKLFTEWDNFEQNMVTANQISGHATVNLQFYLPFSLQKGLQKEKLEAKAYFIIQNGALKNVETFRAITTSMRDNKMVKATLGANIDALEKKLLNLSFQTMENNLIISKGKITIPKMQLKSNALDIDISGWHAFNNDLDYHFDFRLRDLKFNQKNSEFGEIQDDGTGQRIFLHLHGNIDALNFNWDADANKAYRQQQRADEKENVKSILKTELGLFKKDTTVSVLEAKEKPKEKVEIIFDTPSQHEEDLPKEKKKLKKLFGMDLEKMREENNKEKEMEFSID